MPPKKPNPARKALIEAKTAKLCAYSTVRVLLDQAVGELLQKVNALQRLLLPAVPIPDGPTNIDDICLFDQALTTEVAKMVIYAGRRHRKEMRIRYEAFIGQKPPDIPLVDRGIEEIMVQPPTIDELIENMEDDSNDEDEGSVN